MYEYRMARRVLMAEVSGGRMDGVIVALGNRGMTVEAARQCLKYREEFRALVQFICNWMSFTLPFLLGTVLPDRPPVLWWLSHVEGRDAVT